MRILHLSLTNFRNYTHLELDFPPGIVLLQGDNAQGKTNLLEAIYFLSRVRSPRTSVERELVNWLALEEDLPFARLVALVEKGSETEQVELSLVQNSNHSRYANGSTLRKHVRINGVNKRALDAVGVLSAVLFLPQDIDLVAGVPSGRRRYLDDTASQIDPRYGYQFQRYNRVLTERNYLLKSLRGRRYDPAELLFWDQRLIEYGAYLILRRQQIVQQLHEMAQRIHGHLTAGQEHLRLEYSSSVALECSSDTAYQMALPATSDAATAVEKTISVQDIAAKFSAQLQEMRPKELEQGVSLLGPHRDDVRFLVNGVDMNVYGSRGQQRTAALSLKLAEVDLLTQERKDKPILLLDDVISELDAAHRQHLLATLDQAQQVIVTATDLVHYPPEFVNSVTLWRVSGGRIQTFRP